MSMQLTSSLEQDETLKEIDLNLVKLEQVVIQQYRVLLAHSRRGLDELMRFPHQLGARFQQILGKLQRALEANGDRARLRLVTEREEELRIRMLVLEHLLERDIPYAYLERAFQPEILSAMFAHRGEGVERHAFGPASHAPAQPAAVQSQRWLTRILRREEPASAQHARSVGLRAHLRKWFENLPDYLKFLFLLHHFMEKDELRLLKPSQRAPSLGEEYTLHGGVARFGGEDGRDYHWRTRAERRRFARPDDTQLARSLQEKLMRGTYVEGVRSQFVNPNPKDAGRPAAGTGGFAGAEQTLRRKLQELSGPTGVRAAFGEPGADAKPAEESSGLAIDYSH